ncbi:MAG: PEGA domain-containing protein, partial [Deltaproteobacteria bacterium]|nr:PEGA domain-containing protein [Deltaproteobacteria bacterium]
ASVSIDGTPVGTTPLALTTLSAGKAVTIAFKKQGYQQVTAVLYVPGPGKEIRLIQPLVAVISNQAMSPR